MCGNVNAMAAASTASSLFAARSQAKQGAAQADSFSAAASEDYAALAERSRQNIQATTDKVGIRAQQAEREIGRISAVLADSNLVGSSSARLKREAAFNRDTDIATLQANASNELSQTKREIRGVSNTATSRINSIKKPSGAEIGLNSAASFLGAKGPKIKDLWSK